MERRISLAIIIPAYKAKYLRNTLLSISAQTDKDFQVYIGDDASPENLLETVGEFVDRLNITYTRFKDNLGATSLVKHWERCIRLAGNEDWIWLFSDDDIMSDNCVEQFKNELSKTGDQFQVFRFDTIKFKDDKISIRDNIMPTEITGRDFLDDKLHYRIESYVVEYIFKKSLYVLSGGFPDFDLGWCSDDAFWLKCCQLSKIRTIKGPKVYWRWSDSNISGQNGNSGRSSLKLKACIKYIRWLKNEKILYWDLDAEDWVLEWYYAQFRYLKTNIPKRNYIVYILPLVILFPENFLKILRIFRGARRRITPNVPSAT
jgi:glycosyltransferase involved in cell wall biosynthesis